MEGDKFILAQEKFVLGNYDGCIRLLDGIGSEYSDQFELLFTRASCFINTKEYNKAIEDLNQAEKIKESGELNYKRGIAYFYVGDYIKSYEDLRKALVISTTNEQREKLLLWKNKLEIEIEENNIILPVNKAQSTVESNVKVIHNWYQTANNITLSLESNVEFVKEDLSITIEKKSIKVTYQKSLIFDIALSNSVVPNSCTYEVNKKRITFNLKKEVEGFNWVTLDATKVKEVESNFIPSYPTSSKVKKDWTKLDKELEKELNKDVEGEEGMMKLFKEIYERGDENTRRAMIKSMQTSSGTVLSTNWGEVAEKDYEGRDRPEAPKGQDWADKTEK
jgi:suppressor of G2 allele of SKP1